ncbi:MAG: helix-turn-helix transcriptional regulator, partial [Clostridia bacterium]|nr:helix-turn-helix transcriptional regulator [Clostridia bacterium]
LHKAVREMTARLDAAKKPEAPAGESAEQGTNAGSFIVRAAIAYMQENCTQRITLSDVADNVFVSQWHLSKLINRHMGQSFLDILGGMRIERAKQLLKNPSMRVHEVAEQAGFSDVAHFSKSFKKLVGKTPGEYRAGLR